MERRRKKKKKPSLLSAETSKENDQTKNETQSRKVEKKEEEEKTHKKKSVQTLNKARENKMHFKGKQTRMTRSKYSHKNVMRNTIDAVRTVRQFKRADVRDDKTDRASIK